MGDKGTTIIVVKDNKQSTIKSGGGKNLPKPM